jgi:hypothetical protein
MVTRPGIPRFSGGFKTFSVAVSSNRENGTEDRLRVYSQGSRAKIVKYLWLKFLWDSLSQLEMELFILMPETLNDEIKVSALRAVLILPKRVIRQRIIKCPFLPGKPPTRESYLGYKRLDVEILRFRRSLPKVPKFSGWVRSNSRVGSKRTSRGPSFLEPLATIENDYIDITFDWYSYLTVGDISELLSEAESP